MKLTEIEMDKTRYLKYGTNSMIELEKRIGKPLSSLSDETSFTLENLRTMLYVGLKHEDKSLTEEKVGDLIDESIEKHGIEYVSKKMNEAFEKTFGSANATPLSTQ